jgi:ABC-2 type transport system ATP-binding protein
MEASTLDSATTTSPTPGDMPAMIAAKDLCYGVKGRQILDSLDFTVRKGSFLVILGENGAGKTSLLDLIMGFRHRNSGSLTLLGMDPEDDPWQARLKTSYLSEKIDLPGDWDARDFLGFHRFFYPAYDQARERELMIAFSVNDADRVGNYSAGELRRLQIVGALAARPELLIIDEITAVLDIVGRIRFLELLKKGVERDGTTIVLATNIPEGLERYADDVLLLSRGKQLDFAPIKDFIGDDHALVDAVFRRLTHV